MIHVDQLGTGEPKIAVVGAIHGDEPCGAAAIETLLAEAPPVMQPVKCIIANERALIQGVRYIDADLNRVFPGDPTADAYERRLAAALLPELAGCRTLALHSTRSTARPFAIASEIDPLVETICPQLPIDALVDASACVGNTLGTVTDAVEIECGHQGTEQAAETAAHIVWDFLRATSALPATSDQSERELPVFRLRRPIPKEPAHSYAVCATNFERVATGETYATNDGVSLIAEEPFYPVLMSPDGYESQLGYAAEMTDPLQAEQSL
jgi:hypothetical protein